MRARSALFDLYGDHLRSRDNQAPVAALVRLLDPVGIAAPAVRTAISRMVMQDWLEPVALPEGRGYRATRRAIRRLDEAADRIYRRSERTWDGFWHLALVTLPSERSLRTRIRADLAFLGYAEIADGVWISPHPRSELEAVLDHPGTTLRTARADRIDPEPTGAWDLRSLGEAYRRWLDTVDRLVALDPVGHADPDEAAFAARFQLVHEWRKFLFADPGLPDRLLPADWPGFEAARRFSEEAARLKPAADRFVAGCLDAGPVAADSPS
ncbi:PaaX family transcriptional regulator C-terminal domain-containing protein [Nocardioides sp. GCM10027113]|uniref:PaaX family transcriptional regulator n=1 Tax=unclassified Nocardioides TaxID=2615069 RepID=UPI003622F2BC